MDRELIINNLTQMIFSECETHEELDKAFDNVFKIIARNKTYYHNKMVRYNDFKSGKGILNKLKEE